LGGNEAAETTLTEIYATMEAQPNGENGSLLNNGWANIFYIVDINGTLRAVGVRWIGEGWIVIACSVEDLNKWNADNRVFSRNSLLFSCRSGGSFHFQPLLPAAEHAVDFFQVRG
jgi:hypothetical protein